jgi:meso-butanediol dehydrogenase/(S,S)-butanediol dehydrogenase/diacetyl reductase
MILKGKTALITGGGTGIGAAIAKRFVSEGAKVCITGRRREKLEHVAKSLPSGSVETCSGDVTKQDDVKHMVEKTAAFGGKIDVLVNNAGFDKGGSIKDIDPELWREIIETNLTGPFLLMKETIPYMEKNGGGSIINIASLAGMRCLPNMPGYCSSKAGLIMLTQQAALDYSPAGIRCNAVCPGGVRTEMLENSLSDLQKIANTDIDGVFKIASANVPIRRFAKPDEITGICVYLASDESSFTTGSSILVDGGASIVDISGASLTNLGAKWG